jgi:HPt (histidine-containing phosphotransfer) domain-containing protein
MSTEQRPGVTIIGAEEYPSVLDSHAAAEFVGAMKSSETAQRGKQVIALRQGVIGDAVQGYIKTLEAAAKARDTQGVYEQAHEIRGLAATAGLEAAGRIADGLCKYVDTASRLNLEIDAVVIGLHIDAISRAATAKDDTTRLGKSVANELNTLVQRRLAR